MAIEAARANGWDAATEVAGSTPSGERWFADVLASKGGHSVAVEMQWSSQTNTETLRRQECYKQSGVRCLWLLRQPGFPVTHTLPAAQIRGSAETGLTAWVPFGGGEQSLPAQEFLDAAFSKRLRFGIEVGLAAKVAIRVGHLDCWNRSCGARTPIVTSIHVYVGPHEYNFSVPQLDVHPDLFAIVRQHLPDDLKVGMIKRRHSKTLERSYLSNGRIRCDSLIGEFFEYNAYDNAMTVSEFAIRISEAWKRAMERLDASYEAGWGVYPPE